MKKKALQNHDVSLILDPTVKKFSGKKVNQCQPKGYIGQRETYGKAFVERAIYDTTSQMMMQSNPKNSKGTRYKQKVLPEWIFKIQEEIQHLNEENISVKAIYRDREFYQEY